MTILMMQVMCRIIHHRRAHQVQLNIALASEATARHRADYAHVHTTYSLHTMGNVSQFIVNDSNWEPDGVTRKDPVLRGRRDLLIHCDVRRYSPIMMFLLGGENITIEDVTTSVCQVCLHRLCALACRACTEIMHKYYSRIVLFLTG